LFRCEGPRAPRKAAPNELSAATEWCEDNGNGERNARDEEEDRPMTESFAVRIGIDTPLSLRGLLHLDGLLGSLAVARGREATNIPLLKHEGILARVSGHP